MLGYIFYSQHWYSTSGFGCYSNRGRGLRGCPSGSSHVHEMSWLNRTSVLIVSRVKNIYLIFFFLSNFFYFFIVPLTIIKEATLCSFQTGFRPKQEFVLTVHRQLLPSIFVAGDDAGEVVPQSWQVNGCQGKVHLSVVGVSMAITAVSLHRLHSDWTASCQAEWKQRRTEHKRSTDKSFTSTKSIKENVGTEEILQIAFVCMLRCMTDALD